MNKQVNTLLLFIVAILLIAVAIQPLLPTVGQPFSQLGVLGPNKTIGGYPTNVTVGNSFLLYGFIGNQERTAVYYQVMVKLGNETTQVSNSTSADAPIIASYSRVVAVNETYVFPMNLTVTIVGTNQRLIFELWDYNVTQDEFIYSGLWNQLYVNVTRGSAA